MKLPYSVAITAHRDLKNEDYEVIKKTMIGEVANSQIDIIYFGGATGGDSLALEMALDARESLRPQLVVVLPKTLRDQRSDLHSLTKRADSIIELKLSRKIYNDVWWEHDKWMVDNSQKIIAFWDGIESGGTYNAMRYAERQGKSLQHIKIMGRNDEKVNTGYDR